MNSLTNLLHWLSAKLGQLAVCGICMLLLMSKPGTSLSFIFACASSETYTSGYFYYIVEDDSVSITGYFGKDEEAEVPSSIAGLPVSKICTGAFTSSRNLKTIYLPDTIMTIGNEAFRSDQKVIYSGMAAGDDRNSEQDKHQNTSDSELSNQDSISQQESGKATGSKEPETQKSSEQQKSGDATVSGKSSDQKSSDQQESGDVSVSGKSSDQKSSEQQKSGDTAVSKKSSYQKSSEQQRTDNTSTGKNSTEVVSGKKNDESESIDGRESNLPQTAADGTETNVDTTSDSTPPESADNSDKQTQTNGNPNEMNGTVRKDSSGIVIPVIILVIIAASAGVFVWKRGSGK